MDVWKKTYCAMQYNRVLYSVVRKERNLMEASKYPAENIPQNPDSFAAVCKECGNGTLNNAAIEAFEIVPDPFDEEGYGLQCKVCNSNRVEVAF